MALAKRIIPCLDVKQGIVVKGVRFGNLEPMGTPAALAQKYCKDGADEICFLDISATLEGRKTLLQWVKTVASEVDIPFCVGGGVQTLFDFTALMRAGADKVCMNSGALANPGIIRDCAREYGSQAVVSAIDYRASGTNAAVYSCSGQKQEPRMLKDWASECVSLGAGELLLTSIDSDGTKDCFDLGTLGMVSQMFNVPIIASGGAGKTEDFLELFSKTRCTGALAAGVFHRDELSIAQVKSMLKTNGVDVRC